jgi:hypothetical protein
MASSSHDTDIDVFNLIHHLRSAGSNDGPRERREAARRQFSQTQWIAPGFVWEVPPDSAFIEVRCHDLTQNGLAFFLPEPPNFDRLVVILRSPTVIYVAARIRNWRRVWVDASGTLTCQKGPAATGQGESKVLAGCRFIRRLEA